MEYSLDEAEWGATTESAITLTADGSISVADNGRGTDTRLNAGGRPVVEPIMSTLDLRFYDVVDAPRLLDGVRRSGMFVVCALSVWLTHLNCRINRAWSQHYAHGLPGRSRQELSKTSATRTTVRFHPDPKLYGNRASVADQLEEVCAPLQHIVTISVIDETRG